MIRLILLLILCLSASAAEGEWVWAKVTAYCPCSRCTGHLSPGVTATGRRVVNPRIMEHHWGIAADWRIVPAGSRVVVPGYKPSQYFPDSHPWEVDDTGRAMIRAGNRGVVHIDIRYIHHRSAVRWGVRWMWVYIRRDQ